MAVKLKYFDAMSVEKKYWFREKNRLISPRIGGAKLLFIVDGKINNPLKNEDGTYGEEVSIGRLNIDERIFSQEIINSFINDETILYTDTDIISMIKFDTKIEDYPSRITASIYTKDKPIEKEPKIVSSEKDIETKIKIDHKKFTININYYKDGKIFGWFEHDTYGDEMGGSLWFEHQSISDFDQRPDLTKPQMLVDFDGMMVLPIEVAEAINLINLYVDTEQFCS